MSQIVSPCTSPVVSTVTVLPAGDPACEDCGLSILSVAYAACGTLRVNVSEGSGNVSVSLDGRPYAEFTEGSIEFSNVAIGAHQVVVRKGQCTDLWSGSVYCQERRCFQPGTYECVTGQDGVPTGILNTTTIIEVDCITGLPTGRSFPNDGSVHQLFAPERDEDRCADGRCLEYDLTITSSSEQSELVWTDCDSEEVINRPFVTTGEELKICSSTPPRIIKNGSISLVKKGACNTGEPADSDCCTYLVTAFGLRSTLEFATVRYLDCASGQSVSEQIRHGESVQVLSKSEPVIISSEGGSVELTGECTPATPPPSAGQPSFTYAAVQPYCSGATLSDGFINLSNLVNATRYRICRSSQFSCSGDCSSSDGTIGSGQVSIPISPVSGQIPPDVTIRVYSGTGCDSYRDASVRFYSQNCAEPEVTQLNIDMVVPQWSQAFCDQPQTYENAYNMYAKLIAPSTPQDGKQALVGGGESRFVPLGSVPENAYLMACIRAICGSPSVPGEKMNVSFYRFALNLNSIYADYPDIAELSVEIWADRIKGSASTNQITATYNRFSGVRSITSLVANGAADFSRDPLFPGANSSAYILYNNSVTGYRKLCTFTFNRNSQQLTYTPA